MARFLFHHLHWLGMWLYQQRTWVCLKCWRFTSQLNCENCGKWYCLNHCEWDSEATWEHWSPDYPICPHCMEDQWITP